MRFFADLHIHSRFSRATSRELNPYSLDLWARRKGLSLIGTGDVTHPEWLAELEACLTPAEDGLFILRKDSVGAASSDGRFSGQKAGSLISDAGSGIQDACHPANPRFVLSAEVSTIYKAGDRTRKVHHLLLLPSFEAAKAFQNGLKKAGGNISSDGRPILGLDSRDLFEILLKADPRSILIPAHIWTPWFSALGDKSGFNSIAECYRDLADQIGAVETGLSSNPPMNWSVSSLDNYMLVSNSDAHSPENLGREATILEGALSFSALHDVLCPRLSADQDRSVPPAAEIAGTIEFFPEEGKYHYDGHRACNKLLSPSESAALGDICPVCGKRVTVGVLHRVMELADRPIEESRPWSYERDSGTKRRPYYPLVPLREILGELFGVGSASQRVGRAYAAICEGLAETGKGELDLLLSDSHEYAIKFSRRIPELSSELFAEALRRLRAGQVRLSPGYDGEYGKAALFAPGELERLGSQSFLFGMIPSSSAALSPRASAALPSGTPSGIPGSTVPDMRALSPKIPEAASISGKAPIHLSPEQDEAAGAGLDTTDPRPVLVMAGPGSGKTALLVERAARIIERGASPESILVLTFTNKAAAELKTRLGRRLTDSSEDSTGPGGSRSLLKRSLEREPAVQASTFHAFGAQLELFLDSLPPGSSHKETGPFQEELFPSFGEKPENAVSRSAAEGQFLLSATERENLLARAARLAELPSRAAEKLGNYIEKRKRLLLRPGKTALRGQPPAAGLVPLNEDADPDPLLERGYAAYEEIISGTGARDFDSLIMEPLLRLAGDPGLIRTVRKRWPWLLVDEYQDVNYSQYALVRLLSDSPFAIGDPNQAIYGFRGADPRFISQFTDDYPQAQVFTLIRSYRCSPAILEASGRLVPRNSQPAKNGEQSSSSNSNPRKTLLLTPSPAQTNGNLPVQGAQIKTGTELIIRRAELPSEAAEAEWIARHIETLIGGTSLFSLDSGVVNSGETESASPGDIAILLRLSSQSEAVEKALRDHGIPYRSLGERPWWEDAAIVPVLEALRIAAEPRRALLSPGLFDQKSSSVPWFSPVSSAGLRELIRSGAASSDCVKMALELFASGQAGQSKSGTELAHAGPPKIAADTLACLKEAALAEPDLRSFLASLSGGLEESQSSLKTDRVSVLTIHAAKGLEFPFVFIPGLEEGLIPFTLFDRSPAHIDEEARILYVGMTRAKCGLFLSSAARRIIAGRKCEFPPSSFLGKIGTELNDFVSDARLKDKTRHDPQLSLF